MHTLLAISFFPSDNFFLFIICTIFLCNKKYRLACSFKRKGPSHLFNYVCQLSGIRTWREKGRMILHFEQFQHFRSAFFSFLATNFYLFFPNMPFKNAHFSRVRAFQQGNSPLYFAASYVLLCAVQGVQCNTEESP